jgi:group I intron endonuclease
MHYIYKITNIINQKIYIGQTNNPNLRWSQHKSNAKYSRGNQIITKAITKYGSNNFKFEVISTCLPQCDVDLTEEQIIGQYDSRNKIIGYNIDPGGNTSPRSPETSKKISDALIKFYESHDSPLKGIRHSEESKKKMSEIAIGKPGTNTGKTFSNEWAMNISKANAGKERKSRRRFSDEIEKEICGLYVKENKSMYSLGIQFDCYRSLIIAILDRHNIIRRESNYNNITNSKYTFTLEQEKEICDKYSAGDISRNKLSKQYNCGSTTIREILLRNNIKL